MVAEGKAVSDCDNISLIFRVVITEHRQDFNFDLALFVKLLFILKYLKSNLLLVWSVVVHTTNNHAKGSSTEPLYYFIPVINLISLFNSQVVSVFTIEAIIQRALPLSSFIWIVILHNWRRLLPIHDLSFSVGS